MKNMQDLGQASSRSQTDLARLPTCPSHFLCKSLRL